MILAAVNTTELVVKKRPEVRMGFEPITSAISEQRSTNQANKLTGSWSLCWTYMKIIYVAHT